MSRSKKAISPILANLLLIVVAVAAVSASYAWILSDIKGTTEDTGAMLFEANVSFTTSHVIGIDLGNSGVSATTVTRIYVGNSPESLANAGIAPQTVASGGITQFQVMYPWAAGDTYWFKVVSSSGQSLVFSETA